MGGMGTAPPPAHFASLPSPWSEFPWMERPILLPPSHCLFPVRSVSSGTVPLAAFPSPSVLLVPAAPAVFLKDGFLGVTPQELQELLFCHFSLTPSSRALADLSVLLFSPPLLGPFGNLTAPTFPTESSPRPLLVLCPSLECLSSTLYFSRPWTSKPSTSPPLPSSPP